VIQHKTGSAISGIKAVVNACGWSSTSAFIDVFRRAFGHAPGTHYGR
jgi:AraC-like DNA-binding protein